MLDVEIVLTKVFDKLGETGFSNDYHYRDFRKSTLNKLGIIAYNPHWSWRGCNETEILYPVEIDKRGLNWPHVYWTMASQTQ